MHTIIVNTLRPQQMLNEFPQQTRSKFLLQIDRYLFQRAQLIMVQH